MEYFNPIGLVCSTYLDHLAEEVNDKLQEAGLISVAELCKNYDLPGDFLSEVSLKNSSPLMPRVLFFFFFLNINTNISVGCPQELSKRLGKLIQGEKDQYDWGVIFTPAFVARHRARIRGLFSAITRFFLFFFF